MSDTTKYLPTIGLEIHAELKTISKMFCACGNNPDEEKPNVNICPICLGHPGTLPVLNKEAIKHVLNVGIAVNGNLADFTEWDRKNYFYPDIPKGYQLSQYKYPLVSGGTLADIEIERIHLEEDTAQSTHDTRVKSLVNFNRSGVPLMELVTKPVIHDARTAVKFAKELQLLLRYLGAGDANMEKGEMRVEANISVMRNDAEDEGAVEATTSVAEIGTYHLKLGTKTEVKNLNSFRAVERSIAFEIERQASLLDEGKQVTQETRGYDDATGETYSQRAKESSRDYRYFPDPDIPKLRLSEIAEFSADALRKQIPELPWVKRDRYKNYFGLTDKETSIFVESPDISKYFESIISEFKTDAKRIKLTVNYLLTDYLGVLKKAGLDPVELNFKIPTKSFAGIINMTAEGLISSRGAKDLLSLLIADNAADPKSIAEKNGLLQKSNVADLIPTIDKIIIDNATVAADYKAGKTASLQFLIGQAMKATKGAANPEVVRKLLLERL